MSDSIENAVKASGCSLSGLNSDMYTVCPEKREYYRQKGHVLIKKVFQSVELELFRRELRRIMDAFRETRQPLKDRNTYGKAFLQKGNVWRESELVREFVFSRRLAGIVSQLSGQERIRLYHDQALFKEAGGGHTPWHQDQFYWPMDTGEAVTVWMPLMDLGPEHGLMKYVSASHLGGSVRDIGISDDSHSYLQQWIDRRKAEIWQPNMLEAGDAVFHNGWCIHSAEPNQSDQMREVMTVIYFPDGCRLLEPDHEARRIDMEVFFPGRRGGDPADSSLTPLLFP